MVKTRWHILLLLLAGLTRVAASAQEPARTGPFDPLRPGPETEKRFPPLKVPPGFKVTLFACDPLLEYPSVLALGPRPNSVFVAHDYMTGLGEKIVRRDEVRLLSDTNADGYADVSQVYAGGFNSIQGLAYHNGRVFVMHAPFLTVLRDTNGDGVSDERRDLFNGLGWPPEKSTDRLHGANGVAVGYDGWLYLALGDRGCDGLRPEGDRLVLHGGGILRCRPDGTDLHVFSTGLRNIYDVALDAELNVFVRDNENDGGNYLLRVYHSFHGADHGYPYLYQEHPDEALPPLAELGRGSSAGGVVYLEPAFPAAYQGALFFCEWGKSVVTYPRQRNGAGFLPMKETEFATGAPNDPYGFRPTDVIVDRDGSLLVTDWADGQRPKRGRGRLYRIRYDGERNKPEPGLNSESYLVRFETQTELEQRFDARPAPVETGAPAIKEQLARLSAVGRRHAVWMLARQKDSNALFSIAERDPDTSVRGQAVRALADLFDPIMVKHRLEAVEGGEGEGALAVAQRLSTLERSQEPQLMFEITVALGRLRWPGAPAWLRTNLKAPDQPLVHAAIQTLRRSRNWPDVLEWLDAPEPAPLRFIALKALANQAQSEIVDGLLRRLDTEQTPARQHEYVELLARVHRQPGPWVYWGFRPEPRPPNPNSWEKSSAIENALDRTLAGRDSVLRLFTLQRMERERIPIQTETLTRWLASEHNSEHVAAILSALSRMPADNDLLGKAVEALVRARAQSITNRLFALDILTRGLRGPLESRLLELADSVEEPAVVAELLHQLARRPNLNSRTLLLSKLRSTNVTVRLAALDAFTALGPSLLRQAQGAPPSLLEPAKAELHASLLSLLNAPEPSLRAAAVTVLGKLEGPENAPRLLACAEDPDSLVRRRSLEALTRLGERGAVPAALRALERDDEELLAGLKCLAELGDATQSEPIARAATRSRSAEALQWAVRILAKWERAQELARVQGASGMMLHWLVSEPLFKEEATRAVQTLGPSSAASPRGWQLANATNADSRVNLGRASDGTVRLGLSQFIVSEPGRAEVRLSSSGTLDVWLNGKLVHHRAQPGRYATDSDRCEVELEAGLNRLMAQVGQATTETRTDTPTELHVRFRRKSTTERHEHLAQLALSSRGNALSGRQIFFNAEKTGCLKCHHLGNEGGTLGPDLTGIGRRFSKIHLIESILEPSRTVTPAFRNLSVRLKDGQELTGVRIAENETVLTLGDAQAQSHPVRKDQIEELRLLELSIMPEGLEQGLTDGEFADLIAFLAEQK